MNHFTPQKQADIAINHILNFLQYRIAFLRIDAPAGGGKTGIVERSAMFCKELLKEKVMIATQTNEQSFDIARRLGTNFPRFQFYLFHKNGLPIPQDIQSQHNILLIQSQNDIPDEPSIVIANAHKWSYVQEPAPHFDVQIVDEAFQMPDYRFLQIANLADRHVQIGDPGQIAPIVRCEIERWKGNLSGPHVASPIAMSNRHPKIQKIKIPVSRRLLQDTVDFVQPSFYPDLPFVSICQPNARTIQVQSVGQDAFAQLILATTNGVSISMAQLPPKITGVIDRELVKSIVTMIQRLLQSSPVIQDEFGRRPLRSNRIGVVCAHVSQVSGIQELLPPSLSDVLVETADRYQGLERDIMLVYHPLSGRENTSDFHLDAGRLCVMLTRHRLGCIIFGREGMVSHLEKNPPSGERILGIERDASFEGWNAHYKLLSMLKEQNRVIEL